MSIETAVPDSHARCVNPSKLEIPTGFLESTPGKWIHWNLVDKNIFKKFGWWSEIWARDIINLIQLRPHAVSNVKIIHGIVETLISTPNPVTMLQDCREQLKKHTEKPAAGEFFSRVSRLWLIPYPPRGWGVGPEVSVISQ